MDYLDKFLQKNCQKEKLTPEANLNSSFDINKILNGDNKTLINFAKLLLCISSLCSIKDKHLTKVSFLEAETQNEYFSSVELFFSVDNNNEKQNNNFFDINNFDNLNLSESLMNDLKDLKMTEEEKKPEKKEETTVLTLGSSTFDVNNKISYEDNPFEKTDMESKYFGKISETNNTNDNNNKDTNGQLDINAIKQQLINNTKNLQPIEVEKKIYVNTAQETTEPEINPVENKEKKNNFSNIDKYIQNPYTKSDKQTVIVEKKTYCDFVKIGQEGKPDITTNNNTKNTTTNTNKLTTLNSILNPNNDHLKPNIVNNIIITDKNMSPVNEISLFLSGGDFLHKKIDILEETLMKNSEMYNYVIDKYEKELKTLKEEIENMKIKHKDELDNLSKEKKDYENKINNLSNLKTDNQTELDKIKNELNNEKIKYNELLIIKNNIEKEKNDNSNLNNIQINQKDKEILELKKNLDELSKQLNKKDIENLQLKRTIDELKEQKEKELSDFQKQIKDVTYLKDQEISMLNDKIKSEQNNQQLDRTQLEQNFENYKINSNKINNDLMNQNNLLKRQVDEIPFLKQEIEKYKTLYDNIDNESAKLHKDVIDYQDRLEVGGKINQELNQKIEVLERKLNSDPYFAKEIMSKTLYNFAVRIMAEGN